MNVETFKNTKDLFFVSGMFAGGWIWQDTYPQIPNATHHIINEPLCDIGNNVECISDEIAQAIIAIGHPVSLVSNSLGSLVCLHVARLIPDKIKRVIMSGSAGFGKINLDLTLSRHDQGTLVKKLAKLVCFDQGKISEVAESKTRESFEKHFRNIVRLIRESNHLKAEHVLTDVKCPVHAIWGKNDVITPFWQTQEVFAKFGIDANIIDECGHSPMFEKPNEFASLVNRLVTEA